MTADEVIRELQKLGTDHHRNQFTHFGIHAPGALGVTSPDLQKLAKTIGKDHQLAIELFELSTHEAKLISAFLADPKLLTAELMDHWANEIYSWDLCDTLCMHLFRRSPLAEEISFTWIKNESEFVRRCGLVVMTSLSIHSKKASNDSLMKFMNVAIPYVTDERNFVKKAVSWLLRTLGKRNLELRHVILENCDLIEKNTPTSKSARWIVNDVRRELMKKRIIERLEKKNR